MNWLVKMFLRIKSFIVRNTPIKSLEYKTINKAPTYSQMKDEYGIMKWEPQSFGRQFF